MLPTARPQSDDWMVINGQYLEGNENPFPKSVGGGGALQLLAISANGAPWLAQRFCLCGALTRRGSQLTDPAWFVFAVVRQGVESGFSWRGGRDRNTTGIWLWGEAFMRKMPDGSDVAYVPKQSPPSVIFMGRF